MSVLRAAAHWSRPPSAFLGGEEWGHRDHLLVLAYQRYLDTTCSECGGYVLECRDSANAGVYEVVQDQFCYRKAALEEVTGRKDWESEPGQVLSVQAIDPAVVTRSAVATLTPPDQEQDQANSKPAKDDER